MQCSFSKTALAVLACASLAVPLFAADPEKPADSSREVLEQRIEKLERKVQDLEAQLQQRSNGSAMRRGRAMQMPRFGNDMDEMWNHFRREFEQRFGQSFGNAPMGPLNQMGPMGPMGQGSLSPDLGLERRPRLGVEMAPLSSDLVERYKNPVKEGVFITSVVPGSPAETAGILPGDAITSFNGKAIGAPRDLIQSVQSAPKGKTEVVVTRKGESLKLNVSLGETGGDAGAAATDTLDLSPGNWLRRGDMAQPGAAGTRQSTRTEVRASALEMNDKLAADLKLNDEQKTKMSEILARHSKALSDEVSANATSRWNPNRGTMNLQLGGDISQVVAKHVAGAEQDLAAVLSPEQLKQWQDWRQAHSSVSMSQSTVIQGGSGSGANTGANANAGF